MVNIQSLIGGAAGGATVSVVLRAIDDYSKNMKGFENQIKKTEKTTNKFGLSSKLAFAGAAVGFATFATDAAVQAGRYQQILEGTNALTKGFADTLLVDLNKATRETVSNMELLTSANTALSLGLNQNKLPQLFELAAKAARVQGIEVSQAISDISRGIARQSPLILDNLGFNIKLSEAYENYAESIGKSASELTKLQQIEAVQNAVIADGSVKLKEIDLDQKNAANSAAQLRKEWNDAKIAAGGLASVIITPLLSSFNNTIDATKRVGESLYDDIFKPINDIRSAISQLETARTGPSKQLIQDLFKPPGSEGEDILAKKELSGPTRENAEALQQEIDTRNNAISLIAEQKQFQEDLGKEVAAGNITLEEASKQYEESNRKIAELETSFDGMNDATKAWVSDLITQKQRLLNDAGITSASTESPSGYSGRVRGIGGEEGGTSGNFTARGSVKMGNITVINETRLDGSTISRSVNNSASAAS